MATSDGLNCWNVKPGLKGRVRDTEGRPGLPFCHQQKNPGREAQPRALEPSLYL